ncbi:MAG: class I tRNA ligase family protein, partial [Chloroflexota bacterium]|nr:class I tRNA ligase family protein [Chloroflexota bacterium]
HGGPYCGQDRFEARENLWKDMREAGLVIKEEANTINVPRSQRGGEIIEPMVSTQWFVRIQPLAEAALQAVRDGRITIVPEHFTKVYYNWLENIQDWCISRQLWWGHRIPVWYCGECGKMTVTREDASFCAHCGSKKIKQDPDVLDTWFSSGLWPFSTLGWPEQTPDLEYFYPTSMMETGYDILFFWVARMIMSGLEFTGEIPFSTVFLHGLIRDENGRKMSKSYGNVIDPLIVMDELGTDALRFTLLVGSTPGKDTNLSLKKVEANRNFANKLWNATRLVITSLNSISPGTNPSPDAFDEHKWTLADSWIWARTQALIRDVERLFQNNQYGEAGRQIYDFFWSDFADWYLEVAKLQLEVGGDRAYCTALTMLRVLDLSLRMLHPYIPFVTEELWGHIKQTAQVSFPDEVKGWQDALIIASWPEPRKPETWEKVKISNFNLVQDVVRAIRNLRAEKNVKPGQRIPAMLVSEKKAHILLNQASTIAALARIDQDRMIISEHLDGKPDGHVALVVGPVEIYLPLSGLVNISEERERMKKDLAETQTQIDRLEKLLAGPFAEKAPESVVQKERDKLKYYLETAVKISAQLGALEE